jgi:hypothetical protein
MVIIIASFCEIELLRLVQVFFLHQGQQVPWADPDTASKGNTKEGPQAAQPEQLPPGEEARARGQATQTNSSSASLSVFPSGQLPNSRRLSSTERKQNR